MARRKRGRAAGAAIKRKIKVGRAHGRGSAFTPTESEALVAGADRRLDRPRHSPTRYPID